ncbi:AraC family transcriptional regulator [Azospirillum sp. Sh1]|uniref:AraC family transcriptional regulator n=1 Tax=Azospirillum sp. Sh1 TaxID=2607285 RepID=UPI0011EF3BDE|nr:AraC family transcriptional regulator [Azospirillum sp. Sh1]KAA0570737.1 AraC family transcriptional regulator [Azospirillum sp. Sh1]
MEVRPFADGDPLSDILTLAGSRCAVSGRLEAGGNWALRFPPPVMIKFIAIMTGNGWLAVDGIDEPRHLDTGDVIMLGAERPFRLGSDLDLPAADGAVAFAAAAGDPTKGDRVTVGNGVEFLAVGGHVTLDPIRGHLFRDVLPPLIHVRSGAPEAPAMRWLLDQLGTELACGRPGTTLVAAQLAQMLFVQIIRAHLAASGPLGPGWAGALRDARLAPALRLMHGDPGRAWQLGELARAVGMSRTVFAVRFKAAAGVGPLTYLLSWRMRLAERELCCGTAPVSAIALSLGYLSESAFSNAFKRTFGMAPSLYRNRHAATALSTRRSGLRGGAHNDLVDVDIGRLVDGESDGTGDGVRRDPKRVA